MDKAYNFALGLLARREHCCFELSNKLTQRGFDVVTIERVITKLQQHNLQSDERFVDIFCRSRIRQGYGPLRIKNELNNKNIAVWLIDEILAKYQENWVSYAIAVWHKKYNQHIKYSKNEIQKQKKFLYYRGFSLDTIAMVFECLDNEE